MRMGVGLSVCGCVCGWVFLCVFVAKSFVAKSLWVCVCLCVFLRLGECECFEVLGPPPPSVIHKETRKKRILKIESKTKF